MSLELMILIAGFVVGFYMSWNIGANDVANSMASSVGSKAITLRQALLIAGILNFIGAVFIGSHVTDTIRKGIVSPEAFSDPHIALVGAFSAIFAAALWVTFATWKSLPVSTTHAIVGAMIGFGIVTGGVGSIQWSTLSAVVLSWIISPVFSLIISYLMLKFIIRLILSRSNAFSRAVTFSPLFIGLTLFVVILSFLFKTPLGKVLAVNDASAVGIAIIISVSIGYICKWLFKRFIDYSHDDGAEEIFKRIQIGTACYMALSQGANDVANAIGPLAVIYFLFKTGSIGEDVPVPFFLLIFGGIGITCGIAMWGHRVMDTIGHRITTLSNSRGFSVEFAAATTVLVASKFGLPVSTTHAAVGGVVGVGLARGLEAVNFRIIYQIMLYWVLTVPAAALTSMMIYKIASGLLF